MDSPATGGRRAKRPVTVAGPALPGQLADMWSSVSLSLRAIESKQRYYADTDDDHRLGEQLTLLPVLHDWWPLSQVEVADVTTLLRRYASHSGAGDDAEAARDLVGYTKEMIRTRVATGSYGTAPPQVPQQRVGD